MEGPLWRAVPPSHVRGTAVAAEVENVVAEEAGRAPSPRKINAEELSDPEYVEGKKVKGGWESSEGGRKTNSPNQAFFLRLILTSFPCHPPLPGAREGKRQHPSECPE